MAYTMFHLHGEQKWVNALLPNLGWCCQGQHVISQAVCIRSKHHGNQETFIRGMTCHGHRACCLVAGLLVLNLDPSSLRIRKHVPDFRPYRSALVTGMFIQVIGRDRKEKRRLHVMNDSNILQDRGVIVTPRTALMRQWSLQVHLDAFVAQFRIIAVTGKSPLEM